MPVAAAFDVVVVWSFDRFAHSIEQLVLGVPQLGIAFVLSQEALDTSTPIGKAMFTIIGAVAELERNVIRERIVAGLEHGRTHGTKSGAAVGATGVVHPCQDSRTANRGEVMARHCCDSCRRYRYGTPGIPDRRSVNLSPASAGLVRSSTPNLM